MERRELFHRNAAEPLDPLGQRPESLEPASSERQRSSGRSPRSSTNASAFAT